MSDDYRPVGETEVPHLESFELPEIRVAPSWLRCADGSLVALDAVTMIRVGRQAENSPPSARAHRVVAQADGPEWWPLTDWMHEADAHAAIDRLAALLEAVTL